MRSGRHETETGAVMVMVALLLPLMLIFTSFALDAAHFWDFSRNLQNRADAAALAAGVAYGTTCFGTPTSGQLATIGQAAQQYSGPPGPASDLPYSYPSAAPYQNTTNNPGATEANFHLRLNASTSADHGGVNFEMGDFCNATYDNSTSPSADVWVTQEHVPLFFPMFGFAPNVSAHARVTLQGEASSQSVPIAVGDTGFTPCVTVYFKNSQDNSLLGTAVLHEEPNTSPSATNPYVWDNATTQLDSSGNPIANTGPTSVTMPTGANVYTQVFLNNCSGSGQLYDGDSGTGVLYINSHPAAAPTVGTGDPPKLTCSTPADCTTTGAGGAGGVFLTPGTCAPDSYFAVGTDCSDVVNAYVQFDPNIQIQNNKTQVSFVDRYWDPTLNNGAGGYATTAPTSLTQDSSDPTHYYSKTNGQMLSVPASSGIHEIEITWEQNTGSITGLGTCDNTPTNPCKGSFGIQTQAFGACNGCDQPDDSGPIILSQLRLSSDASTVYGENTLPAGTTQDLVITVELGGLYAQKPGDQPATILRFPTSGNHQTGLIDCGQGTGGSQDAYTVYYGCGPNNPQVTGMNPLYVYSRTDNSGCFPATDGNTTQWPDGNHQDCVLTTPGTRRQNIICPLVRRIVGAPFGTTCNGVPATGCPTNHWVSGADIQPGDPRAVQMIITSPVDLASAGTSPQYWIPIRQFATFYITGWDKNISPQCSDNETFPGKGKLKNEQNAAIWGHWLNYEDTSGVPNGQTCDTSSVSAINCVPALVR